MKNKDDKYLKKARVMVDQINKLEEKFKHMKDEELQNMTNVFIDRLEKGETLDDILVEAFAVVKEASSRVLDMKHYDVQLIGGIMLHQGKIAEMKTGEGKTLVATLPVYLNALSKKGVHVVTVNEYLAQRDMEQMSKLYGFLGLSTGVVLSSQSQEVKKAQYNCDITYGTNNELGFDYLRDNMVNNFEHKVQRELNYVIVDEVDSILIDEARTPLIISAPAKEANKLYFIANEFCKTLTNEDYTIDEKLKAIALTDDGITKAEKYFGIENIMGEDFILIQHHINVALKANFIMKKEVDYIVKQDNVLIVDEFTGRVMPGRRYSEGLHQALEMKEGVTVQNESITLATITFQNYFRLYNKLSGMTGTAKTEEKEFAEIYKLKVVSIPTNKPCVRDDFEDRIYTTKEFKDKAIVSLIKEKHEVGQPILVGTTSIEESEQLSLKLQKHNIPHTVLNAKYHEKEASIIAQAGRLNAVTISTNMAGRGTDILIGGNPDLLAKEQLKVEFGYTDKELECVRGKADLTDKEKEIVKNYNIAYDNFLLITAEEREKVKEVGGLCVLGTQRHESRRIDNQLRGRSGRQGDNGQSVFYLSLEDDLMRIFNGDMAKNVISKLGFDDESNLQHKGLTRSVEVAQKKIESMHFTVRKQVVKYDDVLNEQRKDIYKFRDKVLKSEVMKPCLDIMVNDVSEFIVNKLIEERKSLKKYKIDELEQAISNVLGMDIYFGFEHLKKLDKKTVTNHIQTTLNMMRLNKEKEIGEDAVEYIIETNIMRSIDNKWIEHIDTLSMLKEGIHLRTIGQEDPVVSYRIEASRLYDNMTIEIALEVIREVLK